VKLRRFSIELGGEPSFISSTCLSDNEGFSDESWSRGLKNRHHETMRIKPCIIEILRIPKGNIDENIMNPICLFGSLPLLFNQSIQGYLI